MTIYNFRCKECTRMIMQAPDLTCDECLEEIARSKLLIIVPVGKPKGPTLYYNGKPVVSQGAPKGAINGIWNPAKGCYDWPKVCSVCATQNSPLNGNCKHCGTPI